MAVTKKRVTKKRAAKKRVATAPNKDVVADLRAQLKAAKAETREAAKGLKASQRQVAALLKLLETTETATARFQKARVKDAVNKYGILLQPKKRRRVRRAAKKD